MIAVMVFVGSASYLLIGQIPTAFTPQEDQGIFFTRVSGPEGASFDFMQKQMRLVEASVMPEVDSGDVAKFLVFLTGWGSSESVNSGIVLVTMVPWEERNRSTQEVMATLVQKWQQIPGIRAFPFMRSGMTRGGGGQP